MLRLDDRCENFSHAQLLAKVCDDVLEEDRPDMLRVECTIGLAQLVTSAENSKNSLL